MLAAWMHHRSRYFPPSSSLRKKPFPRIISFGSRVNSGSKTASIARTDRQTEWEGERETQIDRQTGTQIINWIIPKSDRWSSAALAALGVMIKKGREGYYNLRPVICHIPSSPFLSFPLFYLRGKWVNLSSFSLSLPSELWWFFSISIIPHSFPKL